MSESSSIPTKKAVFLDRDGTINWDPGYLSDPGKLRLLEGAGEGLKRLQNLGYLLIVVSNQSGLRRGKIRESELNRIHAKLKDLLGQFGVALADIFYCPHTPEENCPCRKPSPKLIVDAAAKHEIDLSLSVMIGDKKTDLQAGRRAGCAKVVLVKTGEGLSSIQQVAVEDYDGVIENLSDPRLIAMLSGNGPS